MGVVEGAEGMAAERVYDGEGWIGSKIGDREGRSSPELLVVGICCAEDERPRVG